MALPVEGTFEYEGELTSDHTDTSEIVVQGRDCGRGGMIRLVGLRPKIRFWGEKAVLIAESQDNAPVRRFSFPVGETVFLVARAGDALHVVRTATGDVGLSLLRDDSLVFASAPLPPSPWAPASGSCAAAAVTGGEARQSPRGWILPSAAIVPDYGIESSPRSAATTSMSSIAGNPVFREYMSVCRLLRRAAERESLRCVRRYFSLMKARP